MSMVNVKNLGFGGSGIPDALPQAIAELQGQRFQIVAGAAAGTVMVVPGMDPEDTIGAIVDLTGNTNIDPLTCSVAGRNAQTVITALTTAADGDTVTVNGKKYTIKHAVVSPSYNAPPNVVPIFITPSGNDAELLAKRLATAIMSGDSTVTATVGPNAASPPAQVLVTVKVRQPGTAGNAYTVAEVGNAVSITGANFTGGVAATAAGFTSTVNLAGKNLLVVWYDKHPGVATAPLLVEEGDDEGLSTLGKAKLIKPDHGLPPSKPGHGLPGAPDQGLPGPDGPDGPDGDLKPDHELPGAGDTKPGPGKPKSGR